MPIATQQRGEAQVIEKEQPLHPGAGKIGLGGQPHANIGAAQIAHLQQFDIGFQGLIERRVQGNPAQPQGRHQPRIKGRAGRQRQQQFAYIRHMTSKRMPHRHAMRRPRQRLLVAMQGWGKQRAKSGGNDPYATRLPRRPCNKAARAEQMPSGTFAA